MGVGEADDMHGTAAVKQPQSLRIEALTWPIQQDNTFPPQVGMIRGFAVLRPFVSTIARSFS